MSNYLVISAVGHDKPGIVDSLSQIILENNCNIKDSRMTVLGGEFALVLLVEGNWNTVAKLENQLDTFQDQLGLTIVYRPTQLPGPIPDLLPYGIDVVALDHPGIVHNLASFFSQRKINIKDMITSSYAAAHTASPMFSVHMEVDIPAEVHIATLREEFMDFCDQLNLDAVIEPIKN